MKPPRFELDEAVTVRYAYSTRHGVVRRRSLAVYGPDESGHTYAVEYPDESVDPSVPEHSMVARGQQLLHE